MSSKDTTDLLQEAINDLISDMHRQAGRWIMNVLITRNTNRYIGLSMVDLLELARLDDYRVESLMEADKGIATYTLYHHGEIISTFVYNFNQQAKGR